MAGRGFAIILVIYVVFAFATGKRPEKKCPRASAYPDCMFDGDRTLWCDLSNYANLNEISSAGVDLSTIANLYLNDSCLRALHPESKMRHFPDLMSLKLNDNFIREIPGHIFVGNPNLEKVDLSTNNIKVIQRQAFKGLRKLRMLSVDNNEIMHLRRDWFQDLTELRHLSLSQNGVTNLKNEHLYTLRSLTSLNLKNNLISAIEAQAFHGLSQLQLLHLDGNLLTDIQIGTFDGLRSLRVLTLSSNKISSWSMVQLPSLCNLEYLSLRDNNLARLNSTWLRERGNRGIGIDLSGNPWECRCEALEFKKELRKNGNKIQVPEIVCQTPKYAMNRNLFDKNLSDEIEFRTNCRLDTTFRTPVALTRCNSTTHDVILKKFPIQGFRQKEDKGDTSHLTPVLTTTKLSNPAGVAHALVLLTTDGNGSLTLQPSSCNYFSIFITTFYALIVL